MKDLIIRQATVADAVGIRDIFIETYGRDYPYSEMYDVRWLQRALADDTILVLVAEHRGRLVGTGWVFLGSGHFCDLIGEFGRLVVIPEMRRHGIGTRLFEERVAPSLSSTLALSRPARHTPSPSASVRNAVSSLWASCPSRVSSPAGRAWR